LHTALFHCRLVPHSRESLKHSLPQHGHLTCAPVLKPSLPRRRRKTLSSGDPPPPRDGFGADSQEELPLRPLAAAVLHGRSVRGRAPPARRRRGRRGGGVPRVRLRWGGAVGFGCRFLCSWGAHRRRLRGDYGARAVPRFPLPLRRGAQPACEGVGPRVPSLHTQLEGESSMPRRDSFFSKCFPCASASALELSKAILSEYISCIFLQCSCNKLGITSYPRVNISMSQLSSLCYSHHYPKPLFI
jgi:hypothetical protein